MKIVSNYLCVLSFLIVNSSILYSQLPTYVPANDLIAWYPYNGNAIDASGNGNNGIVNGATLTNDRFGNSNSTYNFTGITNAITLSNSQNLVNFFMYTY